MTYLIKRMVIMLVCAGLFSSSARAQDYWQAGVTELRAFGTNLNGSGIRVAQVEAPEDDAGLDWEVAPTYVGQPTSLFTWFNNGTSTAMPPPNTLGNASDHADSVAWNFYGLTTGVATNVVHVDNYNVNDFVTEAEVTNAVSTNYTFNLPASNIKDPVVNQSFIFVDYVNNQYVQDGSNEQAAADSAFDNYAAKYNTLFITGAGDGIPANVSPPATCYNGIGVGVFEGNPTSIGPTIDNGRCKPDITAIAPGGATSYSAPLVAGSAAVLMQAGARGDGGSDINSATNIITVKTLLLNGAVKPANWQNVPPSPLDYTYGAGVLNIYNSYEQLAGGKHNDNFPTNIPTGTAHPPVTMSASIPVLNGWDFDTNTSSNTKDGVNHYFFNVTNGYKGAKFTLTTTLAWNRHQNETAINNLELFLYNTANSNLVAASTSIVDNVQHIFLPQLSQGRYDLQVWKAGGANIVSDSEPYALAWTMYSDTLKLTATKTNFYLSWPAYPGGLAVAATSSLNAPIAWSTNNIPFPVFTNNQCLVWLSATNGVQFYQLQTPDF